jgi:hypothetical protein
MCADRYGNIGNCGITSGPTSGGSDAFGRMRVSDTFTLADYSHIYGEEVELLTKTVGTASTTECKCKYSIYCLDCWNWCDR